MRNDISYGPHLFPGGPELYIRAEPLRIRNSHQNIMRTLAIAFTNGDPDTILSQLAKKFDIDSDSSVNLSFMNYGNMQLVYLATIAHRVKVAALINQPHTPFGRVREEFDNLGRLVEIDPRFVVKPLAHFALKEIGHELYASQYIDNARCVAVHKGQGFYDPLPRYHFERFSPQVSQAVNSAMIALFVNYYDVERKRGLAKTQTSGNDFILAQGFLKDEPATVQPSMRIIAARGFVETSLNEYLNLLRQEFLIKTDHTEDDIISWRIKVNHRSKSKMTAEEIENGIKMGLELRKQRTA